MLFALSIGIPLGLLTAKRRGTWIDQGGTVVSLIGISIPIFFLGLMLKWAFAIQFPILPDSGRIDLIQYNIPRVTNFMTIDTLLAGQPGAFLDSLQHLILPAIALGTIPLAIIMRITRASAVDVLNEDYVRTANAKGLPSRVVDNRTSCAMHVPVVTVIGLQTGLLLGGAILTETIFGWGGVGKWMYDAVLSNDYLVIQSGVLLLAMIFVLVNLAGRHQLRLPEPEDSLLVSGATATFDTIAEERAGRALARRDPPDAAQPVRDHRRADRRGDGVHGRPRPVPGAIRPAPRQPVGELPAAVAAALDGDEHPGQDVLSRIIWGARLTLGIAVLSVTFGVIVGGFLGAIAGFFKGWVDGVIMRTVDVMLAIPGLLLAIGIVTFLGPRLSSGRGWRSRSSTSRSSRGSSAAACWACAMPTTSSRRGRSGCAARRS